MKRADRSPRDDDDDDGRPGLSSDERREAEDVGLFFCFFRASVIVSVLRTDERLPGPTAAA